MSLRAAITVSRDMDEVRRLWSGSPHRPDYVQDADAAATFKHKQHDCVKVVLKP